MTTLGIYISLYILLTVVIGIYVAKFVSSAEDYCFAGRKLSVLLCSSTMFSTWFGSETIVGAPAEFLDNGFLGVIEDPFGTALCFILIGLFIARPIYKLNIRTIVDLFRLKYGRSVEIISAIFMILSYFGWIAAQFLAMSIILNVVLGVPVSWGIIFSTALVSLYTVFGGMRSISINDFIQTLVITIGLLVIVVFVYIDTDPMPRILQMMPKGFFHFFPESSLDAWVRYIVAWATIGLGSIPQQDVFQRIMSAKSEKVAVRSSYIAGILYLLVGMLPLFLVLMVRVSDPNLKEVPTDQVLMQAILHHDSLVIKVLFFGALLSAIVSSVSGAVLAPATIFCENILKTCNKKRSDKKELKILRLSVFFTAIVSGIYAYFSDNVYYLVAESSIISLVSLFIPLVAALYWPRANTCGAVLSFVFGALVYGIFYCLHMLDYGALFGLLSSAIGMWLGDPLTKAYILISRTSREHDSAAAAS